jgi:hypothetical protein
VGVRRASAVSGSGREGKQTKGAVRSRSSKRSPSRPPPLCSSPSRPELEDSLHRRAGNQEEASYSAGLTLLDRLLALCEAALAGLVPERPALALPLLRQLEDRLRHPVIEPDRIPGRHLGPSQRLGQVVQAGPKAERVVRQLEDGRLQPGEGGQPGGRGRSERHRTRGWPRFWRGQQVLIGRARRRDAVLWAARGGGAW